MKETSYLTGQNHLIEKIKNLSFMQSLQEKHILDILKLSKLRKYETGEDIIVEGVYDCWIYMIISGEVAIMQDGGVITNLNTTGDIFGELAVIDGKARSATIKAISNTLCLAIDASFFDRLEGEDKRDCYFVFYQAFSEILAARLRNTNAEVLKLKKELSSIKGKKEDITSKEMPNKIFDPHFIEQGSKKD